MKNNKYKINLKGLLLGLGGAVSVIAPLATVISCGGSNEQPKTIDTSSIDLGIKVDDTNIKALPQNLAKYSTTALFADAQRYGDVSLWNRGITHHSVTATVSFLKGLAESMGWSQDKYAQDKGELYIDESNEDKEIVPSTDKRYDHVEALKTIKAKPGALTEAEKKAIHFELGEDGGWGDRYDMLHIHSDAFKGYQGNVVHRFAVNGKDVDVRFGSDDFIGAVAGETYYADIKNPGTMKIIARDSEQKINRVVSVKDAFDKYPILSDDQLHNEIAPYVKATIESFLKLFKPGTATYGKVFDETLDQISFLIDTMSKTTPSGTKEFKIDDKTFDAKLKELNNGSTHWLAIKAFYLGLDESFVSGGYESYNNLSNNTTDDQGNDETGRITRYFYKNGFTGFDSPTLAGIREAQGIMDFTHWAHKNNTTTSKGFMSFIAGKTLEEMDIINGYDAERNNQLPVLIKANQRFFDADTSVNHLWTAFDTNGKTFHEVSEQILRNQFLENNLKYLQADISPELKWHAADLTKTISELRDLVAKNKFLETNWKYLVVDVNGKWHAADLTKTTDELARIVAINKVLEKYDTKYVAGVDLSLSSTVIEEAIAWNKYKDQNQALISATLTQLSLQPADLDSHKTEVKAIVDPQLPADLSFLQTLFDSNKSVATTKVPKYSIGADAALTAKIKDGSSISGNNPLIATFESSPIKAGIIAELSKQGHSLFSSGNYALEKDLRVKIISFTSDSISVSLELDTKTADGLKHTSVQQITLYRK